MSIHINGKTFISGHTNGKTLAKAVLDGKTVYEGVKTTTYNYNDFYMYERLRTKAYVWSSYLVREKGGFNIPDGDTTIGQVGKINLGSNYGYRRTIVRFTKPTIAVADIKKVTLKTAYMSNPINVYGGTANYSWTSGSEGYNLTGVLIGALSGNTEYDITDVYKTMMESPAGHIYLKYVDTRGEGGADTSTWWENFRMPSIIMQHK